MAVDWGKVEDNYKGFRNFAQPGFYTVKCDGVEFKQVGAKGNYVMKFHFTGDNNVEFPTADHFLSKNNDNWRFFHTKNLFIVLGADEATAKKGVEAAEKDGSYDKAVALYERAFEVLLKKTPEVEIEVFQDGKYTRSEFRSTLVAMPHESNNKPASSDVLVEGEEELDLSDIPF